MIRKFVKIGVVIICCVLLLALLSFVPTLWLKTSGMKEIKGRYVTVFYEKEEEAARDVFELTDAESERIAKSLGFDSPQGINIYIYDNQGTFQTKKYGLVALLLNLDWYIGDNRGTDVLLTSPANPGKAHNYDENKYASIHEMVHAYNSVLNAKIPLWFNEGLAGYLSKQLRWESLYDDTRNRIPTVKQMHTSNPVEFANMEGYSLSYTYIEYLDKVHGWDKVISFAKGLNYNAAFGLSEEEIYDGWIEFLKDNYSLK